MFDFSRTFRGVNTDFFFNFSGILLISPTSNPSDFLLDRAVGLTVTHLECPLCIGLTVTHLECPLCIGLTITHLECPLCIGLTVTHLECPLCIGLTVSHLEHPYIILKPCCSGDRHWLHIYN